MSTEIQDDYCVLMWLDSQEPGPVGVDIPQGSVAGACIPAPGREGPNEDCTFAACSKSDRLSWGYWHVDEMVVLR